MFPSWYAPIRIGDQMRAMQEGIKNRYLPNTLQAQLEEQLLKNKYYPENSEAQNRSKNAYADYVAQQARFYGPNINSEMALRGMQGQHFGAQNNLLGAQANELNFENDRRKQIIENARQRSEIEAGQYNQPSSQDANGAMTQTPGQDLLSEPTNAEYANQAVNTGNNPLYMPPEQQKKLDQLNAEQKALESVGAVKGRIETPEQKRAGSLDLERGKQDIKAYEKINEGARTQSDSASEAIKQLEILKQASGKLSSRERGPLAGKVPAFSENAQVYDKTSAALQKAVMDAMKGQGQMSKAKMEFIERIKPNRSMGKAASERIGDTLQAMAERSQEAQPFFTLAEKSGFNHKEAESLWTLYNRERPEYDAKKEAPIKGNLNQYNKYLNRNALDNALKGKSYDPKKVQNKDITLKEVKEGSNNSQNANSSDTIDIITPTGEVVTISESNWAEAEKRGARRK